jgi:hypothetical protein
MFVREKSSRAMESKICPLRTKRICGVPRIWRSARARINQDACAHQIFGTLCELPRRDVRFILDGLNPRFGHRVRRRIEAMQHTARFTLGRMLLCPSRWTILDRKPQIPRRELFKLTLFFQCDF